MISPPQNKIILALRLCAFLIFIGRAYQFLFFNAPFRAILWDQELLSPIVEGWFNTPWFEYATSNTVDNWIEGSIAFNGLIFLIAGIACLVINNKNKRLLKIPIYLGSASLILLAALYMRETFHHYGQFFEHSIQFGIPLVLVYILKESVSLSKIGFILKILIAITFVSHGLYALGYYPVPGNFVNMTITSLGVTEPIARQILLVAGILDLVLSVVIFIPKMSKYVLLYFGFWGLVTAFARIVGPFNIDFIATSIHQTIYQVIYRLPHGLIPLVVFSIYYQISFKPQFRKESNSIKILA